VNLPKNQQIGSALPIQDINYGCANILAQTCSSRQYCWALLSFGSKVNCNTVA